MSVETGGLTAKVEETLLAAPADHGGMSTALRRNLSSPWATALVVFITIMWTIPTFGLLVTSLRPPELANDVRLVDGVHVAPRLHAEQLHRGHQRR